MTGQLLLAEFVESLKKEMNQNQTQESAQKKDGRPYLMDYQRYNKDGEEKDGGEEETNLEDQPTILLLQLFVGHQGHHQYKYERPRDCEGGAPEIEDDKGADEGTEGELEHGDEPEMSTYGLLLVRTRFGSIQENDDHRNNDEVHRHPQIVPQSVHSGEGEGIEDKTSYERE